jgi:hypothetical protein
VDQLAADELEDLDDSNDQTSGTPTPVNPGNFLFSDQF